MLCGYKGWYKRRPGAIRHVFALHAYSFQYTVLENNPVNPRKSSGNLQFRGVWARPKAADRADGIYLSPLGSGCVGRTHVGTQKCRI